jgi:hypothetical protein
MHETGVKITQENHLLNKHGQDARATGYDRYFVLRASVPTDIFPLCFLRVLGVNSVV